MSRLQKDYPWVLKTFQHRNLTDQLREVFYKEVGIWVALERHSNIIRCSHLAFIEDQPFLFLEWKLGDKKMGLTLRSWLRHDPLDLKLALEITHDICRGLIHAREKQPGLVH